MMPNIVSGAKMHGVTAYLFGPGRANEHTNPHLLAASSPLVFQAGGAGAERDESVAAELSDAVDEARIAFGTEVVRRVKGAKEAQDREGWPAKQATALAERHEHVWHCSLALAPDEGKIDEEKWAKIATEFMRRMGFSGNEGVADARWYAVHHGATKEGGDHIHIVASRVREDGTVVPKWMPYPGAKKDLGDFTRAQRISYDLEREFGLRITEGRAAGLTARGENKAEAARATASGAVLTEREELTRRVRAAAVSSTNEAEFVAAVRRTGVRIRPRYAKGGTSEVVGYSVALHSSTKNLGGLQLGQSAKLAGDKAIWHAGGRLARDLTLTQLRNGWGSTPETQREALAAWRSPRTSAPKITTNAAALLDMQRTLKGFSDHVAQLAPDDHLGWYEASRTAAGMLSQLSLRAGGDHQIAAAARALNACSGAVVPKAVDPIAMKRRGSWAQATLLMGMALQTGNTTLMYALVMKQLSDACRAIADARAAGVDAARARELRVTAETTLARYQHAASALGGEQTIQTRLRGEVAAPGAAKGTKTIARPGTERTAPTAQPQRSHRKPPTSKDMWNMPHRRPDGGRER